MSVFSIVETITNTSSVAQAATFNFSITPGMLGNTINSPLTGGEFLTSGINFDILRNGSSVWSSAATLPSNATGTAFNATGDLGLYNGANTYYTINGVSRSIDLGIINANESITLRYTLDSFAVGNSALGPGRVVPEVSYHVPDQWVSRDCKQFNRVASKMAMNEPASALQCVPGTPVFVPGHDVVVPEHTIPAGMTSGSHASSGDPFTIDFSDGTRSFQATQPIPTAPMSFCPPCRNLAPARCCWPDWVASVS